VRGELIERGIVDLIRMLARCITRVHPRPDSSSVGSRKWSIAVTPASSARPFIHARLAIVFAGKSRTTACPCLIMSMISGAIAMRNRSLERR